MSNSKVIFRTETAGADISDDHRKIILDFAEKNGLSIDDKHVTGFLDKLGNVSAVVKYDGWIHLLNKTDSFNGIEFKYSETKSIVPGSIKTVYEWIECLIYRKDREHPIVVREHFSDLFAPEHEFWEKPNRVMRQIALSECARVAFGISGIRDEYSLPTLDGVIKKHQGIVPDTFEKPVRVIDAPNANNVIPLKEVGQEPKATCENEIADELKIPIDTFISSIIKHPAVFKTPNTIIDQLGTRYQGVSLDYAIKVFEKALSDYSITSSAQS